VHFETVAEVGSGKATAGVDYEPRSLTLTFPPNQATVTTTIPIMPDTLAEGAETVKLLLTTRCWSRWSVLDPRSGRSWWT
jgi:hypothetical protein